MPLSNATTKLCPRSFRNKLAISLLFAVTMFQSISAGPVGAAGISVSPSSTPAFSSPSCPNGSPAYNYPGSGDAADPDVVYSGGSYYAFTTGNASGNHIAALVSSSPSTGYTSYTKQCYGSSALLNPSSWEQPNTQTSPGVFFYGGKWIMFYDASTSGNSNDSGHDCLAVATTPSLSPAAPQFTDLTHTPFLCQPTGSIDPSPFVDPANGEAYLLWKQNDGGSSAPAYIWSQPLDTTGTNFVAGSQPTLLFSNDTTKYPWESTVEDPSMAYIAGDYLVLFSAGIYTSPSYSEAVTSCTGPSGPCGEQDQVLRSYGSVLGPGGGTLFLDTGGHWWMDYAAWVGGSAGCTDYGCGAARRLFVAPVTVTGVPLEVPCSAPAGSKQGYWLVASDGGIFNFGNAPFCGSAGSTTLNQPVVGMTGTADGGGYWLVASDGGIFTFGDARFYGSAGALRLNAPVVGMATTADGKGYWLVASDGGIFTYGDATFHGSTGNLHLNAPVVAMAATPDGGGYWLVAKDGGVFSFGDAAFHGSTGNLHLNQPVVGIARTADGGGYWLVGSDGGIFAFGDAAYLGSVPGDGLHIEDVTGMSAVPGGGGYWLVGSDGGIFTFGNAGFDGSMGDARLNKPVEGMAATS